MNRTKQTGCEERCCLRKRELLEGLFMNTARPAEMLIEQLCTAEEADSFRFGAVGLYGRNRSGLDRTALFGAFREVFFHIVLPELTLLLVRADADCRETAEKIADWLKENGLTVNVAYLPGPCALPEARQVREAFEAAAADMFFRGAAECLPLDPSAPARETAEPREDVLRQLRQDMAASLVRGKAEYTHERLEEYLRISAQGSPAMFREYCAGLYFRLGEELTGVAEKHSAYLQDLHRSEKTVFQLIEEANCAGEIMEYVSWYLDQLLARYRPLRESTGSRVAAFVEEYIRNHYMEPVSIEDIAAGVGLSANYVRSIFKSIRGKTIQTFLSEYRLEMSCQLLRDTSLTVGKIGQLTGYNNVSYFCASFQKRYGKTPSEWRVDL